MEVTMRAYWGRGAQIHVHTNGDLAMQAGRQQEDWRSRRSRRRRRSRRSKRSRRSRRNTWSRRSRSCRGKGSGFDHVTLRWCWT